MNVAVGIVGTDIQTVAGSQWKAVVASDNNNLDQKNVLQVTVII